MRALLRLGVLLCAGVALTAQNGTVPVPANIKVDGVPAIPASLPEKLRAYAAFTQTRLLAWHPSGSELLVSRTTTTTPEVHVVSAPGAEPRTVHASVTGSASYGPQGGNWFVYAKAVGGRETTQIYRYDVQTAASTLLTDGKSRNGVPSWANGSNRIAFDSTRRNGKDRDLYVVDAMDPASSRMLLETSGQWSVADWSPDDTHVLVLQLLPGNASSLWTVNVETGVRAAITDASDGASWRNPHYAPDGTIYAVSNRGSELARVWKRAEGRWSPLTRDGDSVESAALSPDGSTLAVVFDRDASSRLELIDARSLKVRVSPKLPAGIITDLQWNRAGTTVGLTLNSVRFAADVFGVDARTGEITRWTTSPAGGIDEKTMPDPEIVRWKTFDEKMISGVLYRPPAKFTGPRPVMINIHGGPSDAYERPRFQGRSGYFLNELGVAIVFPNVRGSFGFGRTFEKLDDRKNREDAVKDIGALLDWIGTQKSLDAKRVMVTGASYGGYMTYAVAARYPDRIRCAYAGSAIANFVSFLEHTEPQRADDRRGEYGDERDPAMRDFLLGISPVTHAAKIKSPLMIAHGKNDPRVPVGQAEEMFEAVRKNDVPVWFVVYEDEGHQIGMNQANGNFHFYTWIMLAEKFLLP